MPWQIAVALVLIGLESLAFMAARIGGIAGSAPDGSGWMPLLLMIPAALATVVYIILGVCIAARLNRARKLAIVVNFIFVLAAVGVLVVMASIGEFSVLVLANGVFSLFMIALLSNERSQAYTHKGGDDWPDG